MSGDTWLISDTHFGHSNILKFTDSGTGELIRGARFQDVDEMNETMIQNWNSVVKPEDTVYHLGDVFFGNKDRFRSLWSRLMGRKRLILGNHDDAAFFIKNGLVEKVTVWKELHEFGLLLSHIPLDPSGLLRHRHNIYSEEKQMLLNVHGHIHQNPSPTEHHRCVCVEQIDYKPINIEELRIT